MVRELIAVGEATATLRSRFVVKKDWSRLDKVYILVKFFSAED
jgi:hypothetical protein